MAVFARNIAYWDRAECAVRNWSTGAELPGYEGPCLVYLDLRGPTLMHTFIQDGKRCWKEIGGIASSDHRVIGSSGENSNPICT